jgi:hypothetical protein
LPDDPVGNLFDEGGFPGGQPIEELHIVTGNAQGFRVHDVPSSDNGDLGSGTSRSGNRPAEFVAGNPTIKTTFRPPVLLAKSAGEGDISAGLASRRPGQTELQARVSPTWL